MSTAPVHPYPGIQFHVNKHGWGVVRLHYSADPDKGLGEQTFVPDLKRSLSPWALAQYNSMADKSMYAQELEVDFQAAQGQLVYHLNEEATLVDSSEMPDEGTDYFALDPHERRPFAGLWCRVDRWDNIWVMREFWPSKVCFRYEDGVLRGEAGKVPEDDNRHSIKEYVEAVQWLESDANPENNGQERTPVKRVIDYAARSQGQGSMDDPDQPNFQQRIEQKAAELARERNLDFSMHFDDAKKDWGVGVDAVNTLLKPVPMRHPSEDRWIARSRLRICKDRCPELIYELKNLRWQQLTVKQAEVMDPTGKPISKRDNLTDNLRYLAMANPVYFKPVSTKSNWRPAYEGVAY